MVDVTAKQVTARQAVATATVSMREATARRLKSGDTPKGDVLAIARIAGIQAAKRTPEWIPLCHGVALTGVTIELTVKRASVKILATAKAVDKTGVEMEALVAASAAALTLYDMLKAIDRGMRFEVELSEKRGGRTGIWLRDGDRPAKRTHLK